MAFRWRPVSGERPVSWKACSYEELYMGSPVRPTRRRLLPLPGHHVGVVSPIGLVPEAAGLGQSREQYKG